jgi:hypothetical protein
MTTRTDHFKIIREILLRLESQIDKPRIDWSEFSNDALSMSLPHWVRIMTMLSEDGLIRGFSYSGDESAPRLDMGNIRLTLRGLEYAAKIKNNDFNFRNLL